MMRVSAADVAAEVQHERIKHLLGHVLFDKLRARRRPKRPTRRRELDQARLVSPCRTDGR